jgi:hypothetical protein
MERCRTAGSHSRMAERKVSGPAPTRLRLLARSLKRDRSNARASSHAYPVFAHKD